MRYLLILILVIYLASTPLFPLTGSVQLAVENPGNISGEFVLMEDTPLRISIDTGWERNGKVPVFLVFSDLEVILGVNSENLSRAISTETFISEMLARDTSLPFVTYEKNPLRTRMELADKRKPIKLDINGKKGMVEVYIGDSRLKLDPLHVKMTGIAPGDLYELTFMGPNVRVRQRGKLVFVPSRGIIYAIPHGGGISDLPPDPGETTGWTVWAIRIEPENENSLTGERGR
ncbi:MAG: hypothetical protein NT166_22885 [Candidatus Aminicenantes bacterium]|nr:hypothetical protein [Candidatus Aminicenantes bacterium]